MNMYADAGLRFTLDSGLKHVTAVYTLTISKRWVTGGRSSPYKTRVKKGRSQDEANKRKWLGVKLGLVMDI